MFPKLSNPLLLCTDLDGTLIPNGAVPESPFARPIFSRLAAHPQITLVYVTGRDKNLIRSAIQEYDLPVPEFAIGDVGTSIYNITDNNWEFMSAWQNAMVSDWLNPASETIRADIATRFSFTPQEPQKQNDKKMSYYTRPEIVISDIESELGDFLKQAGMHSNLIWSLDGERGLGLLDIVPASASKYHAIRFLANNLNFSQDRVIFAGDSGNDLSVLTSDIQAILVANADEQAIQGCLENQNTISNFESLYLAKGGFLGMNGNYSAGILEGVAHYRSDLAQWLSTLILE